MEVTMRDCRKRLTSIWFVMGGLAFAIMILYSFGGSLDTKIVQAWGWFLAATMPTMSIIASNITEDAANANASQEFVDDFYYRLSTLVSIVYLSTILLTLVGWRMTSYQSPYEVMALSSIWIGPLQGIAASILSIFFRKAATNKKRSTQRSAADAARKSQSGT